MHTFSAADTVTYADTRLSDNTDYFYQVKAIAPDGTFAISDPADTFTIAAASGLTATPVSTTEIDLAWTLNVTDNDGVEVDQSTDGINFTPLAMLDASAQTYADTGVTEGNHYWYEVKPYILGTGAYNFSDPADAWTTPIQGVTNTPAIDSEVLTWTNLAPAGTTAIEVDRSDDAGTTWNVLTTTLAADATGYTDTGLSANAEYQYQVRAIESGGPAPFTDALDTFTLPAAPSGLSATAASPTEVDLSWTNNSDSSTAFYIERSDEGGSTFSIIDATDAGATAYADTTVQDDATYWYQVDAISGDQINDNPDTTPASASTPLSVPADLTATTNGQTEIDLSWENTSQAATGFFVFRSTDGSSFSYLATVSSADDTFYSDTALSTGSRYYYYVTATDDSEGQSAPSTHADAPTGPTVYMGLAEDDVKTGQTFNLYTTANHTVGEADPVTGWTVNWGDGNTQSVTGDPSTVSHTYAAPGFYSISAAAQSADGTITANTFAQQTFIGVYVYPPNPTLTLSEGSGVTVSGGAVTLHPILNLDGATVPSGQYSVDWGDGSGVQTYDINATSFSHTYAIADYQEDFPALVSVVTSAGAVSCGSYVNTTGGAEVFGSDEVIPTLYDITNSNWQFGSWPVGDTIEADLHGRIGTSLTMKWGDGTSASGVIPDTGSLPLTHVYTSHGVFSLNIKTANSDETYGIAIRTLIYLGEVGSGINPVPDQVAAAGSDGSLDLTNITTYTDTSDDPDPVAFVDLGDGLGQRPCTVTGGNAGEISFHLDQAPAPGTYSATLYFRDGQNQTYQGSASCNFTLYVWGVSIGDGTNNLRLPTSPGGAETLTPITLYVPRPGNGAVDVALDTSDATDFNVWDLSASGNSLPSPSDVPVLGNGAESATIHVPAGQQTYSLEIGAIGPDPASPTDHLTISATTSGSLHSASSNTFSSSLALAWSTDQLDSQMDVFSLDVHQPDAELFPVNDPLVTLGAPNVSVSWGDGSAPDDGSAPHYFPHLGSYNVSVTAASGVASTTSTFVAVVLPDRAGQAEIAAAGIGNAVYVGGAPLAAAAAVPGPAGTPAVPPPPPLFTYGPGITPGQYDKLAKQDILRLHAADPKAAGTQLVGVYDISIKVPPAGPFKAVWTGNVMMTPVLHRDGAGNLIANGGYASAKTFVQAAAQTERCTIQNLAGGSMRLVLQDNTILDLTADGTWGILTIDRLGAAPVKVTYVSPVRETDFRFPGGKTRGNIDEADFYNGQLIEEKSGDDLLLPVNLVDPKAPDPKAAAKKNTEAAWAKKKIFDQTKARLLNLQAPGQQTFKHDVGYVGPNTTPPTSEFQSIKQVVFRFTGLAATYADWTAFTLAVNSQVAALNADPQLAALGYHFSAQFP